MKKAEHLKLNKTPTGIRKLKILLMKKAEHLKLNKTPTASVGLGSFQAEGILQTH